MKGQLTRFRVGRLHGSTTIDLPIRDNKLVLVAENGMGKTTIANLVFYFLTQQWHRMLDHEFSEIGAELDGQSIVLTYEDLRHLAPGPRYVAERHMAIPSAAIRRIETILRHLPPEEALESGEVLAIARRYGVPSRALTEYMYRQFMTADRRSPKVREAEEFIAEHIAERVVYLPTYRRIERDLPSIFPGISDELREWAVRRRRPVAESAHLELVQFGMQDVEDAIESKTSEIKDSARGELKRLTESYLADIIDEEYQKDEVITRVRDLQDELVDALFSRIPIETLGDVERRRMKEMIARVKAASPEAVKPTDRVLAHFLSLLIGLNEEQETQEKTIRTFIDTCNRYLQPRKQLRYDNVAYAVSLVLEDTSAEPLALRDLSSGEKQIVSLFSHLLLVSHPGMFIIIDEPELSLGVPWQRTFLPDILNSGRCAGLIATTHSPFIFDNALDEYARSLEEFTKIEPVVS